ncbi:MAG: AAA family ATPase [Clostridiaceae bacterium]|nr:AAA family ATPase [Clostridiaceae bacterium]
MGRLSLVIADYDAEYIRNLEKYLILNYPGRFGLTSFSSSHTLCEFLESQASADIILVNSSIYEDRIEQYDRGLVLLLAENGSGPVPQCPGAIRKYQHADRLVSELLRLYTANSSKDRLVPGRKNTCIISVVSPAGGVGKSSIAAGCSMMCAGRGLRTFYLNLEDIASTANFFNGESNQSFSNVLYHLKGSSNLWLRLESAKCSDARNGVHFFKPAESALEMNEFEKQDAVRLIREFKSSCVYDMVFVDTSPGLSETNTVVMSHSDVILLVLTQDPIMESKADIFSKGLALLESGWKSGLTDKLLPVVNFSSGSAGCISVCGYRPAAAIPDKSGPRGRFGAGEAVRDVSFLASLNGIVDQILAGRQLAGIPGEGGGSVA